MFASLQSKQQYTSRVRAQSGNRLRKQKLIREFSLESGNFEFVAPIFKQLLPCGQNSFLLCQILLLERQFSQNFWPLARFTSTAEILASDDEKFCLKNQGILILDQGKVREFRFGICARILTYSMFLKYLRVWYMFIC